MRNQACGAPRRRSNRFVSSERHGSLNWRARGRTAMHARPISAPASASSPGLQARLGSLEEMAAARAEYGDVARRVLAESNGNVGQMGSVADYLDVEKGYERAVEACLGDLLQHVVVQSHAAAAAGFEFVRTHDAGRVGFLVVSAPVASMAIPPMPASLTPLLDVVRVNGPAADAIRAAVVSTGIARDFETARQAAETSGATDRDTRRGGVSRRATSSREARAPRRGEF